MSPTLDLRAQVYAAPLTLHGLEQLDATDLHAAREHWRIHMAAEFASSRVFAAMIPQMMATSMDAHLIRDVGEMVLQEMDHGVLSGRVYAALGGVPKAAYLDMARVPQHDDVEPLEGLLRNVLSVSCTGETLAVAVIGSERERTVAAPLHDILTKILSDEVGHARFGWKLLEQLAPALSKESKQRLSAYLVGVFAQSQKAMCGDMPAVSDAALALGAPDGPTQLQTFRETMEQAILPGLERVGLKARWAFERAKAQVS
jgi:hypothetical protein